MTRTTKVGSCCRTLVRNLPFSRTSSYCKSPPSLGLQRLSGIIQLYSLLSLRSVTVGSYHVPNTVYIVYGLFLI
jgi:hypothetical protein